MRTPDRFPRQEAWDKQAPLDGPCVPTVYPLDDEVREGLLGPDGKPVNAGTARKHPIGFTANGKGTPDPHQPTPPPPPPPPPPGKP